MMRSRVFAMARPRRPATEAEAVMEAARDLNGSAATVAKQIADAVAHAAVAALDRADDPMIDALQRLAVAVGLSPVDQLATCPEIDTVAPARAARIAAFEARGARHLPESAWGKENAQLRAALAAQLANRYARILRAK